jgi:hypothetical protein
VTPQWDKVWPVSEPPDDFALRVVVAFVRQRDELRPSRKWLLAALACCLCVGLVFAMGWKGHQAEAQRRAIILDAQRRDTEERLRRLQNEFEVANRREQELQATLADARDEITRAKLQNELDATRRKTSAAGRAVKGSAAAAPAKAVRTSACSPRDPLCD